MREKLRLLMLTMLCVAFGHAKAQQVTFDFTGTNDYGTGLAPSAGSEFITDDYTWTSGDVKLVSSGRYRWWFNANGNSLRFYTNVVEEVQTSKMVISVPAGNTITQIDLTGSSLQFTANVGEYTEGKWTGSAQSVELTYAGTGTKTIKTINVISDAGGTPVEQKETPTMKFSGTYYTVILGDDFTAPELTYDGDGTVTYASDNEEVATVDPTTGAVDIVGAGKAIITATASETDNFYGATASYTISVAEDQGTHEVVDGTFDFTDNTDYGTGLVPSAGDEYIIDDYTWTAGNVTLVTSGKYRWWLNASGNTLRFYNNVVDEVQTSKMVISVPAGYTISQIDMSGSKLEFTANVGEFASGKWTGSAQSVEFTYTGSGTKQIKTIVVTYSNGETPPPPVEKETPTMKFSNTYFTVILGDDFTAPELTYDGDGTVTYASDNEEVATVDPATGAVDIVGAGKAVITATAAETDNFYEATASYTISVAEDQGTHEVVDGTFDFTDNTDYGTGLTPSAGDEYIYDDYTWTAGNVTLVTSGKYRWWLNANGNTLRLYNNVVDEVQTSKLTISVPEGKTITKIEFTGSNIAFTASTGTFDGNWTGEAQSVELVYNHTKTMQIKTIVVTYSDGGTPPVEKVTPTMKFGTSYFTVVLGDDFTAPELTYDGDGAVTYASDNEEVATVDPNTGAVDIVGVGKAVITATAAETDNFYGATASYTISVADDQGTHEVVDGTFDFSDNTDYGTGLVPSGDGDEYIYDDYTWTAGNVTLVTSGKYRWWLNANGNTLRFYNNLVDEVQTSKMVISVPAGSTISQIVMTGSKLEFTANVGEFSDGTWTGEAQSVEFTYTGTGTKQIKTITVTYSSGALIGDADGNGEVSVADVTKVVKYILNNETNGLNFENADADGNGVIDINDITAIVAIILGH